MATDWQRGGSVEFGADGALTAGEHSSLGARRVSRGGALADLRGGGTEGNERLTAATGALLLPLLAIIGLTIVQLHQLIWIHLFVGLVLIPVVGLKMASTGYRFVRYYTADPVYRRKGPPMLLLRLIAPMVVITTVLVLISGVILLLVGRSAHATFFPIHKLSFFAWVAFMTVHVLAHLPSLPAALRADYAGRADLPGYEPGRGGRVISLVGVLVLGVVLAILLIPDFGAWTHGFQHFHHGR